MIGSNAGLAIHEAALQEFENGVALEPGHKKDALCPEEPKPGIAGEALVKDHDTLIGEGGATLSGGEKQRISIARAMLKDTPIVIFDEATANIDPENEDKLKAAIEELTKNKTIIMIAHRLSTIRNADQILVLNNGKIEQRGNHEELMKQGGLYKTLINMKNKATVWKIAN